MKRKFIKRSLPRKRIFLIIVLLTTFILNLINIIINVPFNNVNLDLWNIVIVVVLYVLTYEIVDKRKKNQEETEKNIRGNL